MINVPGAITVRTINGRNGDFNVGRLVTELGEFNVRDGIEEYAPGQYDGLFTISRVYLASFMWSGRIAVEMRADVESIALTDMNSESPATQDEPLAESRPDDAGEEVPNEDAELFGTNWPLVDTMSLDATSGRPVLRAQVARLKELGYIFQPVGRTWQRSKAS